MKIPFYGLASVCRIGSKMREVLQLRKTIEPDELEENDDEFDNLT